MNPISFEQDHVLITGATKGIGKAIAVAFAKHNAKHISIIGRNSEAGKEAEKEISQIGASSVKFYSCDVSDHKAVEELVKTIGSTESFPTILVNNAGITKDGLLMRMKEDAWDDVININLKSCYNFCKALVGPMMKQRSGRIINISSVNGVSGNAGQTNYSAAKAGMIGFTKALAKETASRSINVNCIAPGFIRTDMTAQLKEAVQEKIIEQIPLKAMGSPEDIANATLFLASNLSSYITGQTLIVDGGLII